MTRVECVLLGGPFDGLCCFVRPDEELPEAWWVFYQPAPSGLPIFARTDSSKGGERYVLSAYEGGPEAFYQHESLNVNVSTRRVEAFA